MDLPPIEWVRGAIYNALIEGMTVEDLWRMAEHAASCEAFDDAVNELSVTSPDYLAADVTCALALMYPK